MLNLLSDFNQNSLLGLLSLIPFILIIAVIIIMLKKRKNKSEGKIAKGTVKKAYPKFNERFFETDPNNAPALQRDETVKLRDLEEREEAVRQENRKQIALNKACYEIKLKNNAKLFDEHKDFIKSAFEQEHYHASFDTLNTFMASVTSHCTKCGTALEWDEPNKASHYYGSTITVDTGLRLGSQVIYAEEHLEGGKFTNKFRYLNCPHCKKRLLVQKQNFGVYRLTYEELYSWKDEKLDLPPEYISQFCDGVFPEKLKSLPSELWGFINHPYDLQ